MATAAAEARINLSPKGYDTFRVINPKTVAYLDLGGSGNETHAHLIADGRITLMFCNFGRPANILRIYGTGRPILPQDHDWSELAGHFDLLPGTRQIFLIDIINVQTSCGWGVPFMEYSQDRDTLKKAHSQAEPEVWLSKAAEKLLSIDGLPTTATDRYIGGNNNELNTPNK